MVKNTSADVEMKDASSPSTGTETNGVEEPKKDPDLLTLEDIREHIRHIEKAVSTKELRYMSRVIRGLVNVRRKLNHVILRKLLQGYMVSMATQRDELVGFLDEPMEPNGPGTPFRPRTGKSANTPLLPEIELYLHLLILISLIDQQKYTKAVTCSELLMKKVCQHNRRTLDMLAARCYFYHSRAYELTNQFDKVRSFLHARLRTSTLRSDHEGQSVILNLLLRNYLHYNLIEQADKLVSKSTFPELATNNEWARKDKGSTVRALRKAPQHSAVGFKQTVHRLAITVELLLGDIPDRYVFRQHSLRKTLAPYFLLTQAVRAGNLAKFNEVLATYGDKFQTEDTYTLIIRLRHNVIKTGVRMINLSYSRISLMDIAQKLTLDSPEDAEYIVAKAIRDGVIEATIDHEKGFVQSKETSDVYMTREPMAAFHQRISFCLDIHNHSVKDRREREQQELESAKEIADEDFDGFP
ncbi:hypothetical protein KUTeg_014899 [Tegillarca granosa]|uniref:PCI domain-containing protein n=1 Tax=Tegillarca granosa TaxID=220873 RepID=A0ABQ9ENS0_TEGGR|nr:hypothetical protein KUTeg_014899 [Tegillarca granosa]